jgi:valyl-tRNA synthetase
VRRFKSENQLSLGAEIQTLHLATADPQLAASLQAAKPDLEGLTRAQEIHIASTLNGHEVELALEGEQKISLAVIY